MSWRRLASLSPVVLGAISLWLPWVAHPAAALILTGLDVPEFVRFMGAAGAPLVTPSLIAFAAPLMAAALSGCLAARAWSRDLWLRGAALLASLWLVSVAFSPLERRTEFVVASALVGGVWLAAIWARKWDRWVAVAALAAGLLAPALAVAQFIRATPALSHLYGAPITWGAGVYLAVAASGLSGLGLLVFVVQGTRVRSVQRT